MQEKELATHSSSLAWKIPWGLKGSDTTKVTEHDICKAVIGLNVHGRGTSTQTDRPRAAPPPEPPLASVTSLPVGTALLTSITIGQCPLFLKFDLFLFL